MLKALMNRLLRKFRKEVRVPVYIPVQSGSSLVGRNVLITGGGSGIGFAIAQACLRNGANVVITGRNKEKLDRAVMSLRSLAQGEAQVAALELDIVDTDSHAQKLAQAAQLLPGGKLDILVNNAGVSAGASIGQTESDAYDAVLDTNLKGTYFLSQAFFNQLLECGSQGNILIVSSSSGIRPAVSPYMVSKWGEVGLTQGLAKKLIPHGITVNGIAPGPTATGMLQQDSGHLDLPSSPAGRYTTAEEIANLAVFLVSDMGRMIVGETIFITGGCATLTKDDIAY